MRQKFYLFSLLAALLVLASCKTAKKMYEKGNYDEAVELAAKKLQKDPDDPKFRDIILSSYRFARNDHESRLWFRMQLWLVWRQVTTRLVGLILGLS